MTKKRKYVNISLPTGIADDIDALVEARGYWPSRGAFVREACIAKIREEKQKLQDEAPESR